MRIEAPMPDVASEEGLALFLLGWFAGKAVSPECPIRVDHVETPGFAITRASGSETGNVVVAASYDGGYWTHFDVVSASGVKIRVEASIIT